MNVQNVKEPYNSIGLGKKPYKQINLNFNHNDIVLYCQHCTVKNNMETIRVL